MNQLWEVLSIGHHKKTGEVIDILPYTWLQPMPELNARKMAWACDTRKERQVRVRPVGETGIGEPHDWLKHAPPAFFAWFKR